MDKTGTLTEGRPEVTRLVPLHGRDEQHLLQIAAAIELRSEHPLAHAIVRHAAERGIRPTPVENYQAVKGKGATAVLDGRPSGLAPTVIWKNEVKKTPEMHRLLEDLSAEEPVSWSLARAITSAALWPWPIGCGPRHDRPSTNYTRPVSST